MLALIRKDFIAGRTILLLGCVVYALFAVTALSSDRGPLELFLAHVVATLALAVGPLLVDDIHDVDELVLRLPPSRSKVVRARYLMVLATLLGGAGSLAGLGWGLDLWFETGGFDALCTLQLVTVFCVPVVLLLSLFLPCCYRFGLGRGTFVFFVMMLALSIVVTVVMQIAGPGLGEGFAVTPEMSTQPESALIAIVDHVAQPVGSGVFYGAVGLSCAGVALASLALSTRFFKCRGS